MLGTYSPVTSLDWAVIVQKPLREAYRDVYDMQRTARLLAFSRRSCKSTGARVTFV